MADRNRNQYNQNWDQNEDRFDQNNDYNQNYNTNQNRNNRSRDYDRNSSFGGASYGNQYSQQNDWTRNQDYDNNRGNYRNEYGNMNSGGGWNNNREDNNRGWGNSGAGYGNSVYEGYNNRYDNRSADRNYGNMNRGHDNRDWWDRTKDEVSSWFGGNDNDRNRGGEHKGKGPKGYTRSDDRIREDVHDRLADDPYVDASDIEVKVENNEVILTGNVYNREQKRRAEDVVESISGIRHVENRIRVNPDRSNNNSTDRSQGRGDYTGTTSNVGGIGRESGTTNEIIRDTGNMSKNR